MERIILLVLVIIVVNVLNRAKQGARTPARGEEPGPFPYKPGRPTPLREVGPYRALPAREVPSVGPEQFPAPFPVIREGGNTALAESRDRNDASVLPASGDGAPAHFQAGKLQRLYRSRDGLLAALVFHELLQLPLGRRAR